MFLAGTKIRCDIMLWICKYLKVWYLRALQNVTKFNISWMHPPPTWTALFWIIMEIFDNGSYLNGTFIPWEKYRRDFSDTLTNLNVDFSCQYNWIASVDENWIIVDFRSRIAMFDSVPLDWQCNSALYWYLDLIKRTNTTPQLA